jgi:hypothetical protein
MCNIHSCIFMTHLWGCHLALNVAMPCPEKTFPDLGAAMPLVPALESTHSSIVSCTSWSSKYLLAAVHLQAVLGGMRINLGSSLLVDLFSRTQWM